MRQTDSQLGLKFGHSDHQLGLTLGYSGTTTLRQRITNKKIPPGWLAFWVEWVGTGCRVVLRGTACGESQSDRRAIHPVTWVNRHQVEAYPCLRSTGPAKRISLANCIPNPDAGKHFEQTVNYRQIIVYRHGERKPRELWRSLDCRRARSMRSGTDAHAVWWLPGLSLLLCLTNLPYRAHLPYSRAHPSQQYMLSTISRVEGGWEYCTARGRAGIYA